MQGRGYNNVLFIATELLLLEEEKDEFLLLLIEGPEAHLHAQLQMKLLKFIREKSSPEDDPGSPWQNAYNESFNGIFRDGCLDRWIFASVSEARSVISEWLEEYNTVRPHGSLRGKTPAVFAEQERLNREVAA